MQQFQELRERTIDLLIVRMPRPFLEEDLVAEMLFDEPFQAIAGAKPMGAPPTNQARRTRA
jgi:DNA-binding transcriptional LysR family regulator